MREVIEAATVVIGAGPAGIATACLLAEAGEEVLIVDEGPRVGGQIWRHRHGTDPPAAASQWLERLGDSQVRCLHGTSVVDVWPDGMLVGEGAERSVSIRGETLVLATGARERFLPFPGWILPGVIGVGSAQALIKTGGEVRGAEVVLAGSGPLLLPVASLLTREGAKVKLIAEQAPRAAMLRFAASLWQMPKTMWEAIQYRKDTLRTPYRFGVWATTAHGEDRVREVELTDGRQTWAESCDLLCCSYGLVPNTEVARWLECEIDDERVKVDRFQRTTRERVYCVGESTGIGGAELSIAEGQVAAAHISNRPKKLDSLTMARDRLRKYSDRLAATFELRPEMRDRVLPETLVCRCEDVPLGRLDPAWTMRQAKLYTRLGMGPCQGRVCGPVMRYLCGWRSDTVRPPLKPCRLTTLSR